jgi:WD40 repeat protein
MSVDDRAVGKPRAFTEHHAGPVSVLRFEPGGTRLLSIGQDRAARVFEDGHDRLASFEVGGVAHAFVPKRSTIALVSRNGDVALVSLRDGQIVGRLAGATGDVTSLDADPAGRYVVAASRDGGVRAYPFVEAAALVTRASERPAPACGLAADGAAIACFSPAAKEARVTELEGGTGGKPPHGVAVSGLITGVAASAKGDHVATWSAEGLAIDGQITSPPAAAHLAVWSTEGSLAVGEKGAVSVWRGNTQASRAALPAEPTSIAFARGGTVWVGLANGDVVPVTGTSVGAALALPKAEGAVRSLAVSDDATSVAVGSVSGRVVIARPGATEGTVVARLHAPIGCLAWAASGRALVAGADRRLVVLDDTGHTALYVGTAPAPVQACVRSTIDDRFSFVAEGGAAWIRLLDLAPLAGARVPDAALDPKTAQASLWRGLPESSFR